ncbi:MAG TPA: universal stress protein [Patescibacteria group bacterium]|nr:universal stress protein [Patescibacteria group bacterium]
MKILFATDGSPSAKRAEALLVSLRLPDPSTIEVLHVDQLFEEETDLPERELSQLHKMFRADIDKDLADTRRDLGGPGRDVVATVIVGRPASEITATAARIGADLLVIGSRGRGALASAVLGSVAAEVVDHAPCPILVARGTAISRVVLATDGSPGSQRAEDVMVSLPFLRSLPVRVVSVAPLLPGWYGLTDTAGAAVLSGETYQLIVDDERTAHQAIAGAAAARLSSQGVASTTEVPQGEAASGIIEAAEVAGADLIVVGSRGKTGLGRLLLGSVARRILYQAPCSVLIVRPLAVTAAAVAVPSGVSQAR